MGEKKPAGEEGNWFVWLKKKKKQAFSSMTSFSQVHLWRLHADKLRHLSCSHHDCLSGLEINPTINSSPLMLLQRIKPNRKCNYERTNIIENVEYIARLHGAAQLMDWIVGCILCVIVCCCGCVFSDPHRRGLEWGDVQRYSLSRRSEVWHVVLHLLYSADTIWKLYPSFQNIQYSF